MGKNKEEPIIEDKEITIPEFVCLKDKYKCFECKLNKYNVSYKKRLQRLFATCSGKPSRRTQCKKRCWFFADLFSIVTAIIVVIAFFCIYSHFQKLLISIAWTIIFAIGMDIICCLIEFGLDKAFESLEKLRKSNYEKKVENLEAIKRQKMKEEERQQEKEKELYKGINEAKEMFESLSNEYFDRLKNITSKSKLDDVNVKKKKLLRSYKDFLKNVEDLLEHVNLNNFYLSEVKVLFQIHLPKLIEYISIYIEAVETGKEIESQVEELTKLLETFTEKVAWIKENLNNSEAENLIYKMQALREVINVHKEDNVRE